MSYKIYLKEINELSNFIRSLKTILLKTYFDLPGKKVKKSQIG